MTTSLMEKESSMTKEQSVICTENDIEKIQKYKNTEIEKKLNNMEDVLHKICKITKVLNIQQEDINITSTNQDKFVNSREMFCVTTTDGKIHRLYQYSETDNIVLDLYTEGYITYECYNLEIVVTRGDKEKTITGKELLEKALSKLLKEAGSNDYEGVCYCREELSEFKGDMCVVHGKKMHCQGKDLLAFRYSCRNNYLKTSIEEPRGEKERFGEDIKSFFVNRPLVQLIMAYYLSGAIRQVLANSTEGIGEYGLVACITGEPASGKTTVTSTLQNVLFGRGRQVSNNVTSIGLYNVIRDSGICPVVRDDSSTDTQNSMRIIKQKVLDIYNIASGRCRITGHSNVDMPLYAPFIESREGNWGLSDMLKPIRQVEGYKYRVLELYCHQGDLTENAQEARRFGKLSDKYRGMAEVYLDYLVDNYSYDKIQVMYHEYLKRLEDELKEKGLEDRYANRTAVILVSAKVCSEAYGIDFNIDDIIYIMISSIETFESRLVAAPDNRELKMLFDFFTAKDSDGNGLHDKYISGTTASYRHKKHYVAFTKKEDIFVIPQALLEFITVGDLGCLWEPGVHGYDGITCTKLDWGTPRGERWKVIIENWVEQGILIGRSGAKTPTHTVKLNGINTSCYKFSWKRIQQLLGDNKPLDMTRFAHDTEEEIEQNQIVL